MTRDEQQAILAIALMAAFADGDKHDREREEVRAVADALAAAGEVNLPSLYRQVLTKAVTIESEAAKLGSQELRQLAYEMALGVCDADGARDDTERGFLEQLQRELGLDPADATILAEQIDAVVEAPLDRPSQSTLSEAELDRTVLNAAILNGALELLPDSLATMAIIPLQMRLVYRIGQSYGYELDQAHVREFIAVAGVGLTGQYLEQAAVRLVGGLLRKVGGRMLGGAGRQAASSAMSFATTWALGQLARRYYAGGRSLDAAMLKQTFAGLLDEAKAVQQQYLPQIQQRANTLDLNQLMQSLRA
ncbi:MAG: GTPase [Limnobacter sp.]|nr:GTPase [Limnobacter sp.]